MVAATVIPQLHLLEQVSSTVHHIGTLAEKLLEALRENPDCDKKVMMERERVREKIKKRR